MKIERRNKEFVITKGMIDIITFGNFDAAREYLATNGNLDAQKKIHRMSSAKRNEAIESYTPTFLLNRRR